MRFSASSLCALAFLANFAIPTFRETPARAAEPAAGTVLPRSLDPRLKIELVAEQPALVTPTGIDVDERGRVFVLESNTHFPPEGYKGHPTDRLLIFPEAAAPGIAGAKLIAPADVKPIVFADGFTHAMSVVVRPAWFPAPPASDPRDPKANETRKPATTVYVATRRDIFVLHDFDGDGKADSRYVLIHLETEGNYPHNALAGFALHPVGWLYFGFGENLGAAYTLSGPDGTKLSGGGEGGNVYRCRPDGTSLEQWCTGFWNPHASTCDAFGRLFTVDNDPDSRPPCRLMQLVPGGDYGYRFRNGRRGLHPFSSWDGEIPGTLPMVAGTGEAPSGIAAIESATFPKEYQGDLLVGSWGDHRIDRFRLVPHGAGFRSKHEPLITGSPEFRPVGLAFAPSGTLYLTDWVRRDYNVHGHGRLWRVVSSDPAPARTPAPLVSRERLASPTLSVRRAAANEMTRTADGRNVLLEMVALHQTTVPARERCEAMWALLRHTRTSEGMSEVLTAAAKLPLVKREPFTADEAQLAALDLLTQFRPETTLSAQTRKQLENLVVRLSLGDLVAPWLVGDYSKRPEAGPLVLAARWGGDLARAATGIALPPNGIPNDPKWFQDPYLFSALIARGTPEGAELLAAWKQSDDPTQRLWLLLTRRRAAPRSEKVTTQLLDDVLSAKRPPDSLTRAALQWIGEARLETLRPKVAAVLRQPGLSYDLLLATLASLDLLDGVPPAEFEKTLGAKHALPILSDASAPDETRALALRVISVKDPVLTADAARGWLSGNTPALRAETLRLLPLLESAWAGELLRQAVSNARNPVDARVEAAAGLARFVGRPFEESTVAHAGNVRAALMDLAGSDDARLREEGLRGLRGVDLPAGGDVLLAARLRAVLNRLDVQARDRKDLAEQIVLSVPGLIPSIQPAAPLGVQPRDPAAAPVPAAEITARLGDRPGDPLAGRRLFHHAKGPQCGACHTVQNRGGGVGPDLSTIARSRTREQLLTAILDPHRDVAPQYTSWAIETESGIVHTGLVLRDSTNSVELGLPDGKTLSIKTSEIASRTPLTKSVMPERLAERMTTSELADLLAYLDSLK
jgi:putative membrane-bound dehydrogenase-like protein